MFEKSPAAPGSIPGDSLATPRVPGSSDHSAAFFLDLLTRSFAENPVAPSRKAFRFRMVARITASSSTDVSVSISTRRVFPPGPGVATSRRIAPQLIAYPSPAGSGSHPKWRESSTGILLARSFVDPRLTSNSSIILFRKIHYVNLMPPDTSTDVKIMAKPLTGEPPTVLMGFPGSGLVGSIALQYMVDQLDFSMIGTMTSKYFPPFAMMAKGLVNVPVRIYEKAPLVSIVADIPIHPMICYEVANGIMDWLDQYHPKEVVAIAGVVTNEPEKRVFGVATTEEALERIKEITQFLPVGSISGIASSILTECKIRGVPGIGLLGETVNAPDPRAAGAALEVLKQMYSLEIDVQPLVDQAEEIEATMHRLSEEVQSAESSQKRENLPMYG